MHIKELKTVEELRDVQELERKIWNNDPIPVHQTITAVKNGGMMLGAFDGEQLIGISYGFPGLKNGDVYLCSHMLGVLEEYRSQKIGEKLKWAQRDIAIEKGYSRMHWTYDPLQTRNGYLNLSKLNGICHTYIENCYGEMTDALNRGLPSDRFEVHWHLKSKYVEKLLNPVTERSVKLAEIQFDEDGLPLLKIGELQNLSGNVYSLPVPLDFQKLKEVSYDHAFHWRMETRKVFQQVFAQGYVAVRVEKKGKWNEYIFVKKTMLNLGGDNDEN